MAINRKNEQPLGVALGALCAIITLALTVAHSTQGPANDISQANSASANANPDALKEIKAEETMLNYISTELEKNKPFDDNDTNNAINTLNH